MHIQEKLVTKLDESKKKTFSLEIVPHPDSDRPDNNPLDIVARLSSQALFVSITWHANRNPPWTESSATLDLAKSILCKVKPAPTLLVNIACIGQTKASIKCILDELISLGICNIFVIQGEKPIVRDAARTDSSCTEIESDFVYASQLISFIRSYTGSHFCIGVPGYPEKTAPRDWTCISEKVALGADFIITQIFLEASSFCDYVANCRKLGIRVPILPGIMPIVSSQSINLIRRLTKSPIPLKLETMMAILRDDSKATTQFGLSYTRDLCKSTSFVSNMHHFFTLNKKDHLLALLSSLELI